MNAKTFERNSFAKVKYGTKYRKLKFVSAVKMLQLKSSFRTVAKMLQFGVGAENVAVKISQK
jgi:hypothetical protein